MVGLDFHAKFSYAVKYLHDSQESFLGAFAAPAIGIGASLLGKAIGGDKPSTRQSNPNSPEMQRLQGGIADFLLGQFRGGASPFAGVSSDLQRQSTGGIMDFLGMNPEQQTLDMLSPGLMDIFGGGSFDDIGQAGLPVFQRELQASLGGLGSSAPGRFGTAFANQGIGLAQRSAQDFALLQAQARQQELSSRLGAAGLLGTLAGQAGQNPFQRLLGAGQLGLAQTQQMIDPQLQLLLGGLGFARPSPNDTIVGPSFMDTISSGALTGSLLGQFFGGGNDAVPGVQVPWGAGGT